MFARVSDGRVEVCSSRERDWLKQPYRISLFNKLWCERHLNRGGGRRGKERDGRGGGRGRGEGEGEERERREGEGRGRGGKESSKSAFISVS